MACVAEDGLDVAKREIAIAEHPAGAGVPEVVHRPVRAEGIVDPAQDGAEGVVVQRLAGRWYIVPAPSPQGPPDRVARRQRAEAVEVEPQPDEGVVAGRQPLFGIGSLAADPDKLVTPVDVAAADAEDFGGAAGVADDQRGECAVAVRAQGSEQGVPLLIGHRSRTAFGQGRVVAQSAFGPERLQRVVVCVRPSSPAAFLGNRVDQRAGSPFHPELVKAADHRVAVADCADGVLVSRVLLAHDRVDRAGSGGRLLPGAVARFRGALQPQDELAHLRRGHLVPLDVEDLEPPPPPQQVVGVAPDASGTAALGDEVTQVPEHWLDRLSVGVLYLVRHDTAGLHHPAPPREPGRGSRIASTSHSASLGIAMQIPPFGLRDFLPT